jgi:hypothetical protein
LANPLFDKKTGMMLPDDVIEKTVEKYEAIRKLLLLFVESKKITENY